MHLKNSFIHESMQYNTIEFYDKIVMTTFDEYRFKSFHLVAWGEAESKTLQNPNSFGFKHVASLLFGSEYLLWAVCKR